MHKVATVYQYPKICKYPDIVQIIQAIITALHVALPVH